MAGEAAAALVAVQTVQLLLATFESSLAFGAFGCPTDTTIDTITSTSYNYVVVGGGSAGAVLAARLSECSNVNVLLLEAGGCPPLESLCAGYFTMQPLSGYDYNMTAVNDGYAAQSLQGEAVGLTSGKMLGGSSALHHSIHVRGASADYDSWNDTNWTYDTLLPYFKKLENSVNETINEAYPDYIGKDGPVTLQVQDSRENDKVIAAFNEINIPTLATENGNVPLGIAQPQLEIGEDSMRQSSVFAYLKPAIGRSNLHVLTGATVTKINVDSSNVATGVTFTYSDVSYTVDAASEVILAAGALRTPQLLMVSGVGPSSHLTDNNITVIQDLPVGDNLQDHQSAPVLFTLKNTTATAISSPYKFPVQVTCAYGHLTNTSADQPEYQSINLIFPTGSAGLLQLCMNAFKYKEDICQKMYEANADYPLLWLIPNVLHCKSRGTVRLNSSSMSDAPLVNLNYFSDSTDLTNLGLYVQKMTELVNTTAMQEAGAEVVDLGVCQNETLYSTAYYECLALTLSSTMWHYSGTAAIGSVVDSDLSVIGVSNLRVVDASVFVTVPGGNINAAVLAVAERAADIIKAGITCTAA